MLKPEILGQLLVMQSFVISLPDEKSIFSFVCRGLLDIPGVSGVHYNECARNQADDSAAFTIPIILGETSMGELLLTVDDTELFAPYLDYLKNFCYMLAVILEERNQRSQNELFQFELEARVQQRTSQLQLEVTEHKQAEQALLDAKAFTESTLNSISDIFYAFDVNGKFLYWNNTFKIKSGYTEQELFLMTPIDFFSGEDIQRITKSVERIYFEGTSIEEAYFVPKEGSHILCEFSGSKLVDSNGKVTGFSGTGRDITERKQAEEEKIKLESQLQQAQKMESVGRLAGGVAHDFNNMLTVILGHAQLGLMRLDPNHPVCADLKEISKTAERSAELTRQLLAFARKQTVAPKVLDLNEIVTSMLKMLQRLISEDINLSWQPAPELWQIRMDPSQIDQILANLCVNARDAIAGVGRITIETANRAIDAEYCAANMEATPGEYVCLSVSDSGGGMDKETQTHIFEPFFTTKELGKGTGLGLATVYGAVKQNNGFINIYSEPGKGTTFSIHLPRETNTGTARRTPTDAVTAVPRGQETILLVEDEPAILNITSMMLEKQGYTVLKAGTPGEALRLAREHVGAIQLLMTDVIMPEMNGRDLAKNVQSLYPNIKRLFMSGYTADVIAHHGVLDSGVYFIQKPFSLPNMAAMVREVLDGNS